MSFKLCTITVFIGNWLLIASAGKHPITDNSIKGKVSPSYVKTPNTHKRSPESSSDCNYCLENCMKSTTHDSGWTQTPETSTVITSAATTPTDEGTPSEQMTVTNRAAQDCPPKDRATLREISGVSVEAAVGILVFGLFVGAMATAALCVCCPSVHEKASAVRSNKKKTCSNGNLEDEEISNANEQKSRPLPLTPLPSLPADIRSTANSGRPASQHIYSESMDLPVGSTNTYNACGYDHTNTKSSIAPVMSPTYGYNKLTNDVIPGTSSSIIADSAYQPLNANRSQNAEYNQLPAVKDDGDLRSQEHSEGEDHQYFVLEKGAEMDSTETGHRDNVTSVSHDYFVLEKK
ncbi:uncharacterized protein LOC128217942 isoform X2 [Mya arenaria]|nr:uncharacterized protein LOC128217942 isoform X2 [Mya arenaria]